MLKSANSIGSLIYYYRLVKNYSQLDLARQLHVTVSAVSSWERGINKPSVDIAVDLANQMGLSLDEFYRIRPKKPKQKQHTLNSTISFEKAYYQIKSVHYQLDGPTKALFLRSQIWGVNVNKDVIEQNLNIQFSVNANKVPILSQKIRVHQIGAINISPEFQKLPALSNYYELVYKIDAPGHEDLDIDIIYRDEVAKIVVPELLLKIIAKPSNALDNVLFIDIFKTDTFRVVLEYFARQDDLKALQEFLVNQYESHAKHLNEQSQFKNSQRDEEISHPERDIMN